MIAACGQMEATALEQAAKVWPVVERLAAQAAERKADLLVLPEMTYPAYWLESVDRYMQGDIERSAKVLERFSRIAAGHRMWLVAGFVEEADGRLFNSAVAYDRSGREVHRARKNFLWDCDNRWFAPGREIRAFDSEFGRMGVLICADCRAPEIAATLAADGAEMLVLPTAWVNASMVRRTYRNVHPDFLIRARAIEFGVPFVCASKSGRERPGLEYVGQSQIVSAEGRVVALAPTGGDHLVVGEVAPGRPRPTEMDDAVRRRILGGEPPFRAPGEARRCQVRLTLNADELTATLEGTSARVARMGATELNSFVKPRCAALDGAQVLVVRGRATDDALVRARAAENRVFVVVAGERVQLIVDPDGAVAWRAVDGGETLELDLGRADLKHFTPETDLWEQRRVGCYRLEAPKAAARA